MSAHPQPGSAALTLSQARRLGAALARSAGHYVVQGEVASLVPGARPDGSWVAGTLRVGLASVGFVAREIPGLQVGRVVVLEGHWDTHPLHGVQFTVTGCRASDLPQERDAVVAYLAANVGGLGAQRAKRVVGILGAGRLLDRLLAEPAVVRPLFPGAVGDRVVLGLVAWARDVASERWCVNLAPKVMAAADVSYALARRIVSYFDGPEVADLIARRDPYRLLEVPGFGWKRADAVARQLGVADDAPERLAAATLHALRSLMADAGHSGVRVPTLVRAATGAAGGHELGVRRAIVQLGMDCELVRSGGLVYLPEALALEWTITDLVDELRGRVYTPTSAQWAAVEAIVARGRLTHEQAAAVRLVAARGISVLTGGPGTGKTHTLKSVMEACAALGLDVQVVAPTGKAAARAAQMTGRSAATVHRLLGGAPGSVRECGPLTRGVLVVEEASMIDAEVAAWLAKNIRPGPDFRLLVVGDEHQLPSVGHGRVLADLLAADVISVSRLTIVQRQATGSRIVQQAHRILERQPLLVGDTHDWTVVPLPGEAEAAQAVVIRAVRRVLREEATSILPRDRAFDARRDLQVLTPRVGGALGVEALNEKLRELVNPGAGDGPWVAGGQRVREGDRVTCIHNDYTVEPDGLMNGEQGVVRAVEGDALRLLLDDGREVRTRGVQNKSVALAFAATVHRAQGSEYPVVLLVYHRSHAPLLDQRVLYTGVTRAKQRVILCADPEALRVSAATGAALERCSGLAARIRRRQRARSAE